MKTIKLILLTLIIQFFISTVANAVNVRQVCTETLDENSDLIFNATEYDWMLKQCMDKYSPKYDSSSYQSTYSSNSNSSSSSNGPSWLFIFFLIVIVFIVGSAIFGKPVVEDKLEYSGSATVKKKTKKISTAEKKKRAETRKKKKLEKEKEMKKILDKIASKRLAKKDIKYNKSALNKMVKVDLVAYAKELGVTVKSKDTKAQIIEKIINIR
jgi:hypothetical protein